MEAPAPIENSQLEVTENQHPFYNTVILQTIFDHCSSSDWRNFRLVCKPWFIQLLHPWRKSSRVCLHHLSFTDADAEGGSTQNLFPFFFTAVTDPNDFMEYNRKPFHHLSIHNQAAILDECPRQYQVFQRIGPWLQTLTLYKIYIRKLDAFERLLLEYTPNLEEFSYYYCRYREKPDENEPPREYVKPVEEQTNLKSLTISIREDDNDWPPPFPIHWITLFSRFPNVENLELSQFPGETAPTQFLKIIEAIKVIRTATDNTTVNIKCLKVQDFIYNVSKPKTNWNEEEPTEENILTEESIEVLRSLHLPLTSLSINLKDLPVEMLITVLKTYTDLLSLSMKENRVMGEHYSESFNYQCLPPKLTKLELEGPIFPNWGFFPATPNLESLIVNMSNRFYHIDVLLNIPRRAADLPECVLEKLTSFQFSHSNSICDEIARFFVNTMPNLKKLKVTVDSKSLPVVCTGWPEMEDLEVRRLQCTNEDFLSHIAKLKDLKSLIIHHGKIDEAKEGLAPEPQRMTRFGEIAIEEYFLRIPNLAKLSALFSQEVNATMFEALQKKIEDTSECQVLIDFPAVNKYHRISLGEYMTHVNDGHTTADQVRDAVDRKHFKGLFKRLAQVADC